MYRKIVWCYIIVLTLLDISLNTKLSAQGKSHGNGVSVHESLIEGISLQEWGGERGAEEAGRGAAALTLAPPALAFGRRALAAAHALSVTITNVANETIHLASVAGTTPDFHASFFESKTLAPQANTTFSVVYLGRGEGPTSAHLYIHTSRGMHKYPVSAVGVASEWRVWPLVGLRVPQNATLEPLLTLYNPTDTTIQITEVYSSGAWLGLSLPEGGGAAPRALWALPPHTARPLVRLRVQPEERPLSPHLAPSTAYIRIKGNMTGGGLIVGVEATPVPPGEYLSPVHIRLRTRGSLDSPETVMVDAGTTDVGGARLEATVRGGCSPRPRESLPPTPHDKATLNGEGEGEGAAASGVHVELLRTRLEAHQPPTRAARLTLDYAKMWAGYEASLANGSGGANGAGGGSVGVAGVGAYCAGWVGVGRAALPYSLRVLPGTLLLDPTQLHVVWCDAEEALRPREVLATNRFPEPIRILHVHFPPEVQLLFHTESMAPLELAAGAAGVACRVRARAPLAPGAPLALHANITLHTNLSDYTLALLLYEGTLAIEWEWPNSGDGTLRLGAVGTSSTRVVGARLHNAGPAPLCVTHLSAALHPASATFHMHDSSCVPAGGWARAVLTVVAPLSAGAVRGAAHAHTRHGATRATLELTAARGALLAPHVHLPPAAPYVPSLAPLVLDNSMALAMRVLTVSGGADPDPALLYLAEGDGAVGAGRVAVGHLQYSPEVHCRPRCYTGLHLHTEEGAAWAARGVAPDEGTLQLDAALQRARYAMYTRSERNFTVHVHTTQVVQVPVGVSVSAGWVRVWTAGAAGAARAGLGGVGARRALRLRARNPASEPVLMQAHVATHVQKLDGEEEPGACVGCVWSAPSFEVGEWRAVRGRAGALDVAGGARYVLLQPGAEVDFTVTFAPTEPADLAAYLYLRNNLTIVERVLLTGRGAHPAFELAGRKPNSSSPIVFEVTECGAEGGAGVARRALVLRNTGRVPLRLRDWRLGGVACAGSATCTARSFRLQGGAPAALQPGGHATLHVHFSSDWTRHRAQVVVSVSVGAATARFTLTGQVGARLAATCAGGARRAPLEGALRNAALLLALLALIGAVCAGAMEAERALRRHRAARGEAREEAALAPRAPLDLRALASTDPAPCALASAPRPAHATTARRRRTSTRRRVPSTDPLVERRAFERWRAEVGARALDERSSRSEDEGAGPAAGHAPILAPLLPLAPPPPHGDAESSSPDSSPPPRDSYSSLSRRVEEEDGGSSGSDSSSGGSSPRSPSAGGDGRRALALVPRSHRADSPHAEGRGSRQRRSSAEARRSERQVAECGSEHSSLSGGGGSRAAGGRGAGAAGRGARPSRRRGERAPSPPAPRPPAAPRSAPNAAPPALRWGASWSDVVSRGNALNANEDGTAEGAPPPLAPIGSDVRRRAAPSHSLFYYGGGAPSTSPAPAPPAEPAPLPLPPLAAEESAPLGGYRGLDAVWGAPEGGAWLWGEEGAAGAAKGAGATNGVRPPPGFAAPHPVRPYDPFQSLASIWTPAALDWRLDAGTPPPAPPPPPHHAPDDPPQHN